MGKLLSLKRSLDSFEISDSHKDTIKRLITHYLKTKDVSLNKVVNDLDVVIGKDSLFVGAESSHGYENDPYVIRVRERVRQLMTVKEVLESMRNEWGF